MIYGIISTPDSRVLPPRRLRDLARYVVTLDFPLLRSERSTGFVRISQVAWNRTIYISSSNLKLRIETRRLLSREFNIFYCASFHYRSICEPLQNQNWFAPLSVNFSISLIQAFRINVQLFRSELLAVCCKKMANFKMNLRNGVRNMFVSFCFPIYGVDRYGYQKARTLRRYIMRANRSHYRKFVLVTRLRIIWWRKQQYVYFELHERFLVYREVHT